jgi:hypothetical protein
MVKYKFVYLIGRHFGRVEWRDGGARRVAPRQRRRRVDDHRLPVAARRRTTRRQRQLFLLTKKIQDVIVLLNCVGSTSFSRKTFGQLTFGRHAEDRTTVE